MKIRTLLYLCFWFFACWALISCSKEKSTTPPSIEFNKNSGYLSTNQTVAIGQPVRIGIRATSADAPITDLVVTLETPNGIETALDSGLYAETVDFTKIISYGSEAWEKWTFMVMDKNRNRSSVSIILSKDPASSFGLIDYYPSITIGMQANPFFGNFFSTANGNLYFADSTAGIQELISLLAYWGEFNVPPTEYTLSSPNETDAPIYYPILSSYNIPKNEVRYKADSTSISSIQFDNAFNDSIILANYTAATTGKRKFKNAKPGYVIPFMITVGPEAGKRGLVRINTIDGEAEGTINLSLKIQK
jgi:hypothetical protein